MLLMHLVLEHKHCPLYEHNKLLVSKKTDVAKPADKPCLKPNCDSIVINVSASLHKIIMSINLHKTLCKHTALKLYEMLILTLLFFGMGKSVPTNIF